MTEKSLVWGGNTTGDAGPYSFEQWQHMYRILFQTDIADEGIVDAYLNELAVTGAVTPVVVNTGAALVDGVPYESTASVSVTIPTPAGATRIDRIVLRKSWSAQTVRITRIAGVEGGGAPALVQSDGTTWDIPLAQLSTTIGGAITVTDQRVNCQTPLSEAPNPKVIALYRTETTIVSDNTEQQVFTATLPANSLSTGNKVSLILWGTGKQNSGVGATATLRLNLGATEFINEVSDTWNNDANFYMGRIQFDIWGDGATNAQRGAIRSGDADDWGTRIQFTRMDNDTAAEDQTSDLTIEATFQWSVSNANTTMTFYGGVLVLYKEL
jgi:hypothetical protein